MYVRLFLQEQTASVSVLHVTLDYFCRSKEVFSLMQPENDNELPAVVNNINAHFYPPLQSLVG